MRKYKKDKKLRGWYKFWAFDLSDRIVVPLDLVGFTCLQCPGNPCFSRFLADLFSCIACIHDAYIHIHTVPV